ncbi:MerR family transcriptional regulator [Verrucomicrobia bacterium]|nr:MerR family transcriptional regulator [bacterium]MDC0299305.1 MerR family transcriptional regulator [Verrucomicrobiota bacterium]
MSKTTTISELASKFSLSRSALLYYDRIGLLRPSKRTSTGHRRYDQEDYERLELICALRKVGLSLQDVIILLDEFTEPDQVSKMLQKRSMEVVHEMQSLEKQNLVLTDVISKLKHLKSRSQMVRNIWLMFRFADCKACSVETEEATK